MIFAATMWDDGLVDDFKIMEIVSKYNATTAFALSPSRYNTHRTFNDPRGDYGTLVSKKELKNYSNFEVCNHTDNHPDFNKIGFKETEKEIIDGKNKLQEIFGREINGFCYPYGSVTKESISVLKNLNISYARTTFSGSQTDRMQLKPDAKWNIKNLIQVIESKPKILILWGHSYEIKTAKDWESVKETYHILSNHENVKIITFEEMAIIIKEKELEENL